MQTSVTLSAPVFSSLCMVVQGGGFLSFVVGRCFSLVWFEMPKVLVFSMIWSLGCLGIGLNFFEVAPHFDGIGDRAFCFGIDSAEDVVFMRLLSLPGENL